MLVFVHGTGSSTLGSFGDLRRGEPRPVGGAGGSASPAASTASSTARCRKARSRTRSQLVARAAAAARRSRLVSHSRGGLVADLLCLGDFDALIERYALRASTAPATPTPAGRRRGVRAELDGAPHAEQRDAAAQRWPGCCARRGMRGRALRAHRQPGQRHAAGQRQLRPLPVGPADADRRRCRSSSAARCYSAFKRVVDRDRPQPHQPAPGARHRGDAARLADGAAAARRAGAATASRWR